MSPSRVVAAVVLLGIATDTPAADPPPRTDLAGDPLPPGAIARLGTTRYRVRGWHQQVFFSADGNTVIGKAEQSIIRFWDAATGKVTGEIKDPDLFDWNADISPDAKYLIVFGRDRRGKPLPDSTLRLYDLTTRREVWSNVNSEAYHSGNHRVRFTPDGKRIVTAAQDVRVWDAKSGDELLRQKIANQYGGLDVSPDGKTIALGYYEFYLWDWDAGAEPRKTATGLRFSVHSLRFAPDGKTVYLIGMGMTGSAKGIDPKTGNIISQLEVGGAAQWVAFSPDGMTYAVGYHRTSAKSEGFVSLRETKTGKEVGRLLTGADGAANGNWSKDGSRFAAVSDSRVWVWNVKARKPFGPDVPAHEGSITDLAFAPDGRLFTASDDHTVRAWDPTSGKELLKLPMDGWARGLAVSPDGALVAGNALRNDLRVWDAKSGKAVFKLHGHGQMGGLRRVRFSADEQTLLSYGDDFYLRAWNTLTGKLKAEHRYRPKSPFAKDDSEDDDRMEMFVRQAMDLGPDGNTIALATDKDVIVYAADTGKERFKFEADPQQVNHIAFSPDGKRLVTAGPGVAPPKAKAGKLPPQPRGYQLSVWDLAEAKLIVQFRAPGSSFSGVFMFTPDGKSIVTNTGDAIVRFWNATTGAAAGIVECPDRVARVAFDAAGKRIAVAFWDTTALVYDLKSVLKPATTE